jgi:xylan 1,4-beta-xylosidase
MKYLLDKGVLQSGCKPIIGLAQVPTWLAKSGHPLNIPTDWKKWEDLNYRFTRFLVQTYGRKEVSSWIFENWNEPGTEPQFKGDPEHPERLKEDLFRLMDHAIAGVTRALPEAFIAGDSGGIGGIEYLEHCVRETNYATGKTGGRLDAISLHGYLCGSGLDISWRSAENAILTYQEAISRVARDYGRKVKLLNTEFAPIAAEGQPDLKAIPHERNNHLQAIAALHTGYVSYQHGVSVVAFFHQAPGAAALYNGVPRDQVPEFTGTNTCLTYHGVITPVCRAYQMMSMLNGGREVPAAAANEPVWALATVQGGQIRVLCYSYDPDPQAEYTTRVRLSIAACGPAKRYRARRYELSSTKANSWYLAQQMHLTQADCERDISLVDRINRDSDLRAEDAGLHEVVAGKLSLRFELPAYSAVLYVLDPAA